MYKTHREETREAKQEEDEEKKSKLSEMEATTFCAPSITIHMQHVE
jgi:hypothetical protein